MDDQSSSIDTCAQVASRDIRVDSPSGLHLPSLVIGLIFATILCLMQIDTASAQTAPDLGSTHTYGVLSSTFTNSNTSPQTIIRGDVCFTTGPTTPPLTITGATLTPCPAQTGLDQAAATASANGQTCTFLGAGAITLDSVVIGANPPGTIPPGCYSSGGAMLITATANVTLDGNGVYIFRPGGALTTGANSTVVLADGACAANVFWVPVGATTLGANDAQSPTPTFSGNILDAAGITIGHFANLTGRALAFGGTITTDADTITVPTCGALAITAAPTPALSVWAMLLLLALMVTAGLAAMRGRTK
jgi:Ice-binding-like